MLSSRLGFFQEGNDSSETKENSTSTAEVKRTHSMKRVTAYLDLSKLTDEEVSPEDTNNTTDRNQRRMS